PGRVCPSREPRLSVGFRPRLASEYFRFPRQIPQLTLLSSPRLPVSADDSEHTRLVLPHHNFNLPSGVAAATNAESCWPNKGRNSQFARATRFRSCDSCASSSGSLIADTVTYTAIDNAA